MTGSSTRAATRFDAFLAALAGLPVGYSQGHYQGERWGVTLQRSADGRRARLYGEALGLADHVSFNLYRLAEAARLKPCEMPADKVIDFVIGFRPDET